MRWFRVRRGYDRMRDVSDEVQSHLDARVEHLIDRGMSPEQAREEALRKFGDLEAGRRAIYASAPPIAGPLGISDIVHDVWQDVRYVARGLARSPGLTIGVISTFALGLGINSAVFRVADFALLRPPAAVPLANEVRRVESTITYGATAPMKSATFSYRDASALASSNAFAAGSAYVNRATKDAAGRDISLCYVDDKFFTVLGVQPSVGRTFSHDEGSPGSDIGAAIISDAYWRRAFGAVPIDNVSVRFGNRDYPVIAVLPKHFSGIELDPVDIWMPLGVGDFGRGTVNGVDIRWYESDMLRAVRVVGRAAPGMSAAATAERLSAALQSTLPSTDVDITRKAQIFPIVPVGGAISSEQQAILKELSAVAFVVLIIACANAVNLLLARGLRRRQEIAIRLAIGAGRGRVARLLLIESLMLAIAGGSAAVAASFWCAQALRGLLFPDAKWDAGAFDNRTLLFTALLTLAAGVIAGLAPAIQATSPRLTDGLKQKTSQGGARTRLTRTVLIVGQTGLSLALLVASGLLVRSMIKLNAVPMGFGVDGLVTAAFDAMSHGRAPSAAMTAEDLSARIATAAGLPPGNVALTSTVPFGAMSVADLKVIGSSYVLTERIGPRWAAVDDRYFSVMRTPLLQGRLFGPADGAGAEPVAIINAVMAKTYFNSDIPPGACLQSMGRCMRIVGVVEDVRDSPNGAAPAMRYYLPLAQDSGGGAAGVIVRTPAGRAHDAARLIRSIVPAAQRVTVEVISDRVDKAMRPWRTATLLFGILGALALALACVGVYSVMSCIASERVHELGIRVVLGATPQSLLQLVLGDGLRMALIGGGAGLVLSAITGHYLGALLFGVSPFDPITYAVGLLCLIAATLAAVLSPARRASRVDPIAAFRAE